MKKIIIICSIWLLCPVSKLFSQNVDMPAEKIENLLCKKWKVDHALMGDQKLDDAPSEEKGISFEFKKNKAFISVSISPKHTDRFPGTWIYDSKKKRIDLITHGKAGMSIIALNETELVMVFNIKSGMPEDKLKFVYKVKTD